MKRTRTSSLRAFLSIVLVATLGLGVAVAAKPELPEAPDGFEWKRIKRAKMAFLVPDGWHFKSVEQGKALAYFITKENIDDVGRFETGLSININRRLEGVDAVAYAREFVAGMIAENTRIDDWTTDSGVLKGFGCLTRNAVEGEDVSIVMHTLAIGNEETNTLYILFFESLAEEWDRAWEIGERMLRMFVIDDEV